MYTDTDGVVRHNGSRKGAQKRSRHDAFPPIKQHKKKKSSKSRRPPRKKAHCSTPHATAAAAAHRAAAAAAAHGKSLTRTSLIYFIKIAPTIVI